MQADTVCNSSEIHRGSVYHCVHIVSCRCAFSHNQHRLTVWIFIVPRSLICVLRTICAGCPRHSACSIHQLCVLIGTLFVPTEPSSSATRRSFRCPASSLLRPRGSVCSTLWGLVRGTGPILLIVSVFNMWELVQTPWNGDLQAIGTRRLACLLLNGAVFHGLLTIVNPGMLMKWWVNPSTKNAKTILVVLAKPVLLTCLPRMNLEHNESWDWFCSARM